MAHASDWRGRKSWKGNCNSGAAAMFRSQIRYRRPAKESEARIEAALADAEALRKKRLGRRSGWQVRQIGHSEALCSKRGRRSGRRAEKPAHHAKARQRAQQLRE